MSDSSEMLKIVYMESSSIRFDINIPMGSIFGLFTSLTCIGPALGPFLGGVIYDRTGSYDLAFLIGVAAILSALILTLLLKTPKKQNTPVSLP